MVAHFQRVAPAAVVPAPTTPPPPAAVAEPASPRVIVVPRGPFPGPAAAKP